MAFIHLFFHKFRFLYTLLKSGKQYKLIRTFLRKLLMSILSILAFLEDDATFSFKGRLRILRETSWRNHETRVSQKNLQRKKVFVRKEFAVNTQSAVIYGRFLLHRRNKMSEKR